MRIEDLGRELGVTARSIRRDLKALEVVVVEIEHVDVENERRVRIKRTGRTSEPVGRLTRFQKYSLGGIRKLVDVLEGTPFHDDLTQVFAKFAPIGEDEAMGDRFVYIPDAPKNYRRQKDQIYEIYDGVLRSLQLQFQYEGGTTPGTRKVEPWALVWYKNGLYVVGRDVVKDAVRTFAVERMRRVKALGNMQFKRDPKFNVQDLFDGAFGIIGGAEKHRVVVDFAAKIVQLVEPREWHATQTMTRTDSGELRVEFEVSSLAEVVTWVLGWGSNARVVAPAELARRVREEHQRAASQYESV